MAKNGRRTVPTPARAASAPARKEMICQTPPDKIKRRTSLPLLPSAAPGNASAEKVEKNPSGPSEAPAAPLVRVPTKSSPPAPSKSNAKGSCKAKSRKAKSKAKSLGKKKPGKHARASKNARSTKKTKTKKLQQSVKTAAKSRAAPKVTKLVATEPDKTAKPPVPEAPQTTAATLPPTDSKPAASVQAQSLDTKPPASDQAQSLEPKPPLDKPQACVPHLSAPASCKPPLVNPDEAETQLLPAEPSSPAPSPPPSKAMIAVKEPPPNSPEMLRESILENLKRCSTKDMEAISLLLSGPDSLPKIEATPEPPSPAPSSVSLSLSQASFQTGSLDGGLSPDSKQHCPERDDSSKEAASKCDEGKETDEGKKEPTTKETKGNGGTTKDLSENASKGEAEDEHEVELTEEQKKELLRIKKARHARYMRFSRSLKSTLLS